MPKKDVIDALEALHPREGRLTPDVVLEAARDPDSPLHTQFNWDDTSAAHQHRLDQARRLIVSVEVRIKYKEMTIVAPAYVRDPSAAAHEQGYRKTLSLRSDAEVAHVALVEEMRRVAALLKRARSLAVVLGVEHKLGELEAEVIGFTAEMAARREASGDGSAAGHA